jgi:hypothetical protein
MLLEAAAREGFSTEVVHADTTSFSVQFLNDHDKHCFDIEAEVIETEQKKSRGQPRRPPKDWEPYETVYKIAAS